MSDEVPQEMKEADRLTQEAITKISVHVNSVLILLSKRGKEGGNATWDGVFRRGDYYASYGLARQWVLKQEAMLETPPSKEED